jgi:hypothetical protein
VGLRDWFNKLLGGGGEQAYNRAEEEHDFELRVDIDAIKADKQSALTIGELEPNEAERLSDPDAR